MLNSKNRAYDIMRKMVYTNDSIDQPKTEYGRTHKFLSHYIGRYFTEIDNETMQWVATTISFHTIELILMDLQSDLREVFEYGVYDSYEDFESYGVEDNQLIELNRRVGKEIKNYDNRLNFAKDRHCLKWSDMITRCAFFSYLSTLGSHLDDEGAFEKYVYPILRSLRPAAVSAIGYKGKVDILEEYLKFIYVVSIDDTCSKTDPKELPFINDEHMLNHVSCLELKELFSTEHGLDTFLRSTLRVRFPEYGYDIIEKWSSPLNSSGDLVGNDGTEDATLRPVEEFDKVVEKEIEEKYMEYMNDRAVEEVAMNEESYKWHQEAEETDKTVKPVEPGEKVRVETPTDTEPKKAAPDGKERGKGKKNDEPTSILTPRVLRYFEKAIECELLQKTEEGYLWIGGTGVLRDYFLGRVFCGDFPGKSEGEEKHWRSKERALRMPCSKLCIIFNDDNVGRNRQNRKWGSLPEGHHSVDKLYDAVTLEIEEEKKRKRKH